MTSQDLFKTGEEKAFFTDRMKHTSTEDREGVLTNTQSLQSYHFHHAATGVPGAGRSCPSEFCLCFSMRSRAHSPSPQLKKHGKWQTCSPPLQKSTQQSRDPLCRLAEGWNSSSSSSVVFVLLDTASSSPTIAKVEQQRAGKRHQLPVSSPICALEHLPKTFLM